MQLERLRYFLALVETRHFGRAARLLHLSQPALSQQIQRLERDLGVTLCRRTSRGVVLTPAGQTLAEGAKSLVRDYARLVTDTRDAAGHSTLRLAYTRSDAELVGHGLIERFRAAHPRVTVAAEVGWTSWNIAQLAAGTLDAAFVRGPVTTTELSARVVVRGEMVAILPTGHPMASRRRRLDPADLVAEPFLFWPRPQGPEFYDEVLEALWGQRAPAVVNEQPDADHLLAAVAHGAGFTVLDRARADRVAQQFEVRVCRFADPVPTTTLSLAWRTGRERRCPPLAGLLRTVPTRPRPAPTTSTAQADPQPRP